MRFLLLVTFVSLTACSQASLSGKRGPASQDDPLLPVLQANKAEFTLAASGASREKLHSPPGVDKTCMACKEGKVCLQTSKPAVAGQIFDFQGTFAVEMVKEHAAYSDSCVAKAYAYWDGARDACTKSLKAVHECGSMRRQMNRTCSNLNPQPRSLEELRIFMGDVREGRAPACAYRFQCGPEGSSVTVKLVTAGESTHRTLRFTRFGDAEKLGPATFGELNRCLFENGVSGNFVFPQTFLVPASLPGDSAPAMREEPTQI